MDRERKPSGQVIQDSEEITGSDRAPVHADTGAELKIQFVDGKRPEVRKIPIGAIEQGISDPSGPSA